MLKVIIIKLINVVQKNAEKKLKLRNPKKLKKLKKQNQ